MKTLLTLILTIAAAQLIQAQVQPTEANVNPPARVAPTKATIYPLIWQASIDTENITIPLSEVAAYGIQEYAVGTTAYVREFTITLKSNTLIRTYYLTNRLKDQFTESTTLDSLKKLHEKISGQKVDPVYKIMPDTTHKPILEYRVVNKGSIDQLYNSLHETYVRYLIRNLVAGQRDQAIETIEIESGARTEEETFDEE